MGTLNLFKPKWKNSDPIKRMAAVKNLKNKGVLAEVAKNDEDFRVRREAVWKLNDQKLLAEIAKKDREKAVKLAVIEKLTDHKLLEEIVKNDKEKMVRQAAIEKLRDWEDKYDSGNNKLTQEYKMKKCASCNKEINDLYHQCPHCGGEIFIQSGSAEDSSSWYNSMVKQSEASKLVDKSVKLIMEGKYTEAEKVLKKAIEINPYNATAHGNMGGVFHHQGRFEEAIPWFEKALELNPNLEGVPEALREVRAQFNTSKGRQ